MTKDIPVFSDSLREWVNLTMVNKIVTSLCLPPVLCSGSLAVIAVYIFLYKTNIVER